jgi:hypothetical protein
LESLSHKLGRNPPSQRMHLDFLHGVPFTRCNHGVRTCELWGLFLSTPNGVILGFPARARMGQFRASAKKLTFLMDSLSFSVFDRFPLSPRAFQREATVLLLMSLKRRPLRQRSPHRRIVGALSPVAYMLDLPTVGRRGTSPVRSRDHFLQAAARITPVVHCRHTAHPAVSGASGRLLSASSRGGDWRTAKAAVQSPGVSLPGPFVTAPSPDPPVGPPWLRTLSSVAEVRAESSVRARTRTGRFQLRDTSFRCFTVCSKGRLSPEPSRLTHPEGVDL